MKPSALEPLKRRLTREQVVKRAERIERRKGETRPVATVESAGWFWAALKKAWGA